MGKERNRVDQNLGNEITKMTIWVIGDGWVEELTINPKSYYSMPSALGLAGQYTPRDGKLVISGHARVVSSNDFNTESELIMTVQARPGITNERFHAVQQAAA